MVKIVDCSIGLNEVDLFEIRIAELRNVVDHILIVEANKTHSGARKPPMFAEFRNRDTFGRADISHYLIEDMPEVQIDNASNRFILEIFHRNCIMRGLAALNLADEDIVLISDVDEIPKSTAVEQLPLLLDSARIVIFEQILLRFFVNNVSEIHHNMWPWLGTVACRYGLLRLILPQTARVGDQISPRAACVSWGYDRDLYSYEKRIYDAGWHLTSMGGLEAYSDKMSAVSEGLEAARPMYSKSPRGQHNFRDFRNKNLEILDSFRRNYCPNLLPISLNQPEELASLNIPRYLMDNLARMNHFYYFSECVD